LGGEKPEDIAAFHPKVTKPFAKMKGQLPWPIKGAIIRQFGSPRFETRWDGVLISATEGTDIRAVTAGHVVFADWLRGYGLMIILDHGGGYMTLYAFNQSLYKKVGESVAAGTVIAAVGSSGGREDSGLYFGIRSKGKPVNPVIWCKKG
jgi:septal ring factor EnvC (AmiA/AmiB activator)